MYNPPEQTCNTHVTPHPSLHFSECHLFATVCPTRRLCPVIHCTLHFLSAFVCLWTDSEKDLYSFGLGQFGQLGHGTFIFESRLPRVVEHFRKGRVKHIACGENHSAVLTGTAKAP